MELKIFLYADKKNKEAVAAKKELTQLYRSQVTALPECDVIISLGGDGTTLDALRLGLTYRKKVYGMNLGHVGALQNKYKTRQLQESIQKAVDLTVYPLRVKATSLDGRLVEGIALNEVYLYRGDNGQSAKLTGYASHITDSIQMTDRPFMQFKVCGDGYLLASGIGSWAYNKSCGGHLLDYKESLLASTSIASSIGVQDILPDTTKIHIDVTDLPKRYVSLFIDQIRLGQVNSCDIFKDFSASVSLLLDPEKMQQFEKKGQTALNNRPKGVKKALQAVGFYRHHYNRV